MDIHRFGKRKCEIVLTKILNETQNKHLNKKIFRYYAIVRKGIEQIMSIDDIEYKRTFCRLWREDRLKVLDGMKTHLNLDEMLYSHLRCCVVGCFRKMYDKIV